MVGLTVIKREFPPRPGTSMGHQDRDGHVIEHVGSHPPEYPFPPTGVSVRAHHYHIGTLIGGSREQHVCNTDIVDGDRLGFTFDAVPGEVEADVRTGYFAVSAVRIYGNHVDMVGLRQMEWTPPTPDVVGPKEGVDPRGPTASKCQWGRASSSQANRRVRDED